VTLSRGAARLSSSVGREASRPHRREGSNRPLASAHRRRQPSGRRWLPLSRRGAVARADPAGRDRGPRAAGVRDWPGALPVGMWLPLDPPREGPTRRPALSKGVGGYRLATLGALPHRAIVSSTPPTAVSAFAPALTDQPRAYASGALAASNQSR